MLRAVRDGAAESTALPLAPTANVPSVDRVASAPADSATSQPPAGVTPGTTLTGGWEDLAESVRLAMIHPSTTSVLVELVTDRLTEVSQKLDLVTRLLTNLAALPRVAILPVACGQRGP